jgi:hypothetical protein
MDGHGCAAPPRGRSVPLVTFARFYFYGDSGAPGSAD